MDLPESPTCEYGEVSYSHDFCYASERQRISLEYQDLAKIRQKVGSERSIKEKKDLAIEGRNGTYAVISLTFLFLSLVYLVYSLFAGNVIVALIIVAIAFVGLTVVGGLGENEAKVIEIRSLDDVWKLPKGGYAKFCYHVTISCGKNYSEMDFDNEILSEILSQYKNTEIYIQAVTQADVIEELTSREPSYYFLLPKIAAKLRFKRLYYSGDKSTC